MANRLGLLLYLCVISLLISCETLHRTKSSAYNPPKAKYDISLIAVGRSVGNTELQRKQEIETVVEQGVARYSFEDKMVKMIWRGAPIDIVFTVYNKADQSLKIIWDDTRFIDEKGISHRLNHSGIGYEERNQTQPPTIVAPRSKLDDFLHPADYFQWEPIGGKTSDRQDGYWDRAPFLPTQIKGTKGTAEELRAKTDPFIGKTFQVILPLEMDNIRIDYLCTFRINKAEVTQDGGKDEKTEKNLNETKERKKQKKRLF